MALLAEYALTPDVFDQTSYSSDEVCGLHLQTLKEVLLHEGIVRDLRDGEWRKVFGNPDRVWHMRGKELLKKLVTQGRLSPARAARTPAPMSDAEWCEEAIASHLAANFAGIVVSDGLKSAHANNLLVAAVSRLSSTTWWAGRSSSLRVARNAVSYAAALDVVLRHSNSLMLIDPYLDPTDHHQYSDLFTLLEKTATRTPKPMIEIHRAAWYGGSDKRPRVAEVVAALKPFLDAFCARTALSVEVFLWDDIHDRYLISDLVGINLPYGFATTKAEDATTIWTRLGRDNRDDVQREFDPAASTRGLRHRFRVSGA